MFSLRFYLDSLFHQIAIAKEGCEIKFVLEWWIKAKTKYHFTHGIDKIIVNFIFTGAN